MAEEKYLVVKGSAGLGNRLLVLAYAIRYAQETDRKLVIDWTDGMYGQKGVSSFADYFELKDMEYLTAVEQIPNWENASYYPASFGLKPKASIYELYLADASANLVRWVPKSLLAPGRFRLLHRFWRHRNTPDERAQQSDMGAIRAFLEGPHKHLLYGQDLPLNLAHQVVMFADFAPFHEDTPTIFRQMIQPVSYLQEAISQFAELHSLASQALGLHIRQTDKQGTQVLSRLFPHIDSFLDKIDRIFLATDNPTVKQELIDRYGEGRVLVQASYLPDVQAELTRARGGIHHLMLEKGGDQVALHARESVLDMWLLSRCAYLLYQGNSSFSRIASYLHHSPDQVRDWFELVAPGKVADRLKGV